MEKDELFSRIRKLNIWVRGDSRAPHKPLLLLHALGRLRNNEESAVPFAEIEEPLTNLLRQFGPHRDIYRPEQPFVRLRSDGLWELLNDDGSPISESSDVLTNSKRRLRSMRGGLTQETVEIFRNDPSSLSQVVFELLDQHFPESYHLSILDAVGLGDVVRVDVIDTNVDTEKIERRKRDPQFRELVLRAYRRRCAICGSDIRLGDALMDLEAAHIKWHTAGGPDIEANGLALCSMHHKAFDRGAIGLKIENHDYRLMISADVNGSSTSVDILLRSHNKVLEVPHSVDLRPADEYVGWHSEEVFRRPSVPR